MSTRDWIEWADEVCDPYCELPQLTGVQSTLGDAEVCGDCGRLWRLRSVTEYECDDIAGEPIPGSFTPVRTGNAWIPVR